MEERLELVAAVCADGLDPERELLDDAFDVVDEIDGVGLGVTLVDLQCADPRRIVDRGVLVASHRAAPFPLQSQELDIYLPVMARDPFLVAVGVHRSPTHPIREPIEAMALANPIHRGVRGLDIEVALQVPNDPNRPHGVRPAQVQDLLYNLVGCLVRVVVMTTPSAAL